MRIIDRYILRETLIPIVLILYTLIFLFIVGDLFDNLYEIINNKVSWGEILKYYLLITPFAFVQTISWAIFLGILFVFSNLTRNSEIVAMKSCGLKVSTIALPVIYLGIMFSVITFVVIDKVIPPTIQKAEEIKKTRIEISDKKHERNVLTNLTLLSNNRQYFIKKFNYKTNEAEDIRIHFLDKNNNVIKKIIASKGFWKDGRWVFKQATLTHLDKKGYTIGKPENIEEKEFPSLKEMPKDLIEANINPEFMSIKELKKYIKKLKLNRLNVSKSMSNFYNKIAYPWQSLAIVFITVPIVTRSSSARYGISKNIFIALAALLLFHLLGAIALALGSSGLIPPIVSAWLANITAVIFGIFMFDKANY